MKNWRIMPLQLNLSQEWRVGIRYRKKQRHEERLNVDNILSVERIAWLA